MLWHCDYYDGPLSGLCHADGKFAWFTNRRDLVDRNAVEGYRDVEAWLFDLYEITPDELITLLRNHADWMEFGGAHTTYGC